MTINFQLQEQKYNNPLTVFYESRFFLIFAQLFYEISVFTLMRKLIFILFLFYFFQNLSAQTSFNLGGKVFDENNEKMSNVSIKLIDSNIGTTSNENGEFKLTIPSQAKDYILEFSHIGYQSFFYTISANNTKQKEISVQLQIKSTELEGVSVHSKYKRVGNQQQIDVSSIDVMPDLAGSVESIIKTLPGVGSTSELSNQYFVRGGNFDENLVYVNDIEIHRPFLVKSGQQEGLSFINSNMVSSITFSAGGFEAKYGDKMSSVLDITYKTPTDFAASVTASLLGTSAHVEGVSTNGKFTYLGGIRYKTTEYLLGTLDTDGDYKPRFTDFQSLISYQISPKTDISFLTNYSNNTYNFIPETRSTSFGTFTNSLNLTIYYDGQEKDQFQTFNGASNLTFRPNDKTVLKFIGAYFKSVESISYDIKGQYWINELDGNYGSDTFGDSIANIAVGTFLNHARDFLDVNVASFEHKGGYYTSGNNLKWGVKYQYEAISDHISEWEMLDSADYNIPYNGEELELSWLAKAQNTISAHRFNGYVQDAFNFIGLNGRWNANIGTRLHYWTFNKEFLVSPRASFSFEPFWDTKFVFFISGGMYYQPPFYKEMKNPEGQINPNIEAQQSIQVVAGSDLHFIAWNRPFKLTSEIYFKKLNNLVPYKIDNVQLIYLGENKSSGYATGIDFKLNGEFVKNAESWLSISLLKTQEDIVGDFYIDSTGASLEKGYYSRPTDQRVNVNLFFQDYLPNLPSYRVHLNVLFATGLPFSSADKYDYYNDYNIPPYKRVDAGFSFVIKKQTKIYENKFLDSFDNIWLTAEVFNMLDINNTISYLWVKTITNTYNEVRQYAVPNYLTGRRLNVKLVAKF